ncbi:MAG: alpha/beta hydrolase [Acidimicrobiia bacterium]|nr:alpha/beta hydrolase [Acidimicrobiia bacterium]
MYAAWTFAPIVSMTSRGRGVAWVAVEALMRWAVVMIVLGVLAAGCAGEAQQAGTLPVPATSEPTSSDAATTATAAPAATAGVVEDLVYRSAVGGLGPGLVDVWASPGGEGGPVVVLLPGGGATRDDYRELAGATAERGAAVFVPDWGNGEPFTRSTRDDLAAMVEGASCAVSYALAHAVEYGGDPERLVLLGHSAGAMVAAVIGLRPATPIPECAAAVTPFRVGGMVLWEGDWMLIHPGWDRQGDALPSVMETITPWAWLSGGPATSVVLITTAARESRCGMTAPGDPYWLRDPDGRFREQLEALGALADGCIDVGETNAMLAAAMEEQGFDVRELFLEESTHDYLSRHDQALLVVETIAIADR